MAPEKKLSIILAGVLVLASTSVFAKDKAAKGDLAKNSGTDVAQATPPTPAAEPTPTISGTPAPAPAAAPRTFGGHVGVATPFVTVAKTTTTIGDQFTILNPIGLTLKMSPELAVDFEFVIATDVSPAKMTHVIVDPGVIYNWGKFATGLRVAWQIQENANFGLIPLFNLPLVDLGGATWFAEAAFPTFLRHVDPMADNGKLAFNVVLHTGIGF
jgi:hypothetical protein